MPNLTQIVRSIPGGSNAVNTLRTKSVKNLSQLATYGQQNSSLVNTAIQGAGTLQSKGEEIHNKAMSWVRGKLGYSTESIGDLIPMPETIPSNHIIPPATFDSHKPSYEQDGAQFPIPNRDAGNLEGELVEMKPVKHNHTVGAPGDGYPDIEHFISNYVGNAIYGEPMTSSRFLVLIRNPKSAKTKSILERFGGPTTQGTIDDITLFGCRSTSLPGKELQTYQYTTHGAESDYPYITSYDTMDINFTCTSAAAIEKRWFDGWMSSVIDPETMAVGYKDDFATEISIAILNTVNNKILEVEIQGAYPISLGAIDLSHANGDELIELTVTFAYDQWLYKEIVE